MAPNGPHTSEVTVTKHPGTSASRLLSPFMHSDTLRDSTKIDSPQRTNDFLISEYTYPHILTLDYANKSAAYQL